MTRARHLTATGDPADLRAVRIREAFASAYRRLWERTKCDGVYQILHEAQAECLEALEEAEVERERVEAR